MKQTDLMIGDIVDYRGEIIKVTSLYAKNGSNEVGFGKYDGVWVDGSVIKPITLTPEILIKNGFEKIDGVEKAICREYGHLWVCWDGKFLSVTDRLNTTTRGGVEQPHILLDIPVKYIHELQHGLMVCGITYEIVV